MTMGYHSNIAPCLFPPLLSTSGASSSETLAPHRSIVIHDHEAYWKLQSKDPHAGEFGTLQIVKAAWSLILRSYTGHDQVCFRITTSATEHDMICFVEFGEATSGRLLLRSVNDGHRLDGNPQLANTAVCDGFHGDLLGKKELPPYVRLIITFLFYIPLTRGVVRPMFKSVSAMMEVMSSNRPFWTTKTPHCLMTRQSPLHAHCDKPYLNSFIRQRSLSKSSLYAAKKTLSK